MPHALDQHARTAHPENASEVPRWLATRLERLLRGDVDVVALEACGLPGPTAAGSSPGFAPVPDFVVTRRDGQRTGVIAVARRRLLGDRGLGGLRERIEAECRSRSFGTEFWTEREIASVLGHGRIVMPAPGVARSAYAAAIGDPGTMRVPRIVLAVANRAGLVSLARTPTDWVGRCPMTGIPMVVLPGSLRMSADGMLTWTPPAPRTRVPPQGSAALRSAQAAEVTA